MHHPLLRTFLHTLIRLRPSPLDKSGQKTWTTGRHAMWSKERTPLLPMMISVLEKFSYFRIVHQNHHDHLIIRFWCSLPPFLHQKSLYRHHQRCECTLSIKKVEFSGTRVHRVCDTRVHDDISIRGNHSKMHNTLLLSFYFFDDDDVRTGG